MVLQKNDVVEISYEARINDSKGKLFDTSNPELAKKEGLKGEFENLRIILGRGYVIKGLDEAITSRKVGEEFEVTIKPEKGYGEWKKELVKVFPQKELVQNNVKPVPGLIINMGGIMGVIKSVTSGRVRIDFNHPLAGKTLWYKVRIIKKITKKEDVIRTVLNARLKIKKPEIKQKKEEYEIEIEEQLPNHLIQFVEKELEELGIRTKIKNKTKKE